MGESGTRLLGHLTIHVERMAVGVRVRLGGCIDEHADLDAVRLAATDGPVTLDLGEVTAMNSAGVSRWIHLLEALALVPGRSVSLARLPFGAFVMQAAMIANMIHRAKVESVFAPYECSCGAEQSRLVTSWAEVEARHECGTCREQLTLGAEPSLLECVLGPRPVTLHT